MRIWNKDCWAFRTLTYATDYIGWTGQCKDHLTIGSGMLSWHTSANEFGPSGTMLGFVFGDFTFGRVGGHAYGRVSNTAFKGTFQSGMMISSDTDEPVPSGLRFAR